MSIVQRCDLSVSHDPAVCCFIRTPTYSSATAIGQLSKDEDHITQAIPVPPGLKMLSQLWLARKVLSAAHR